MTKIKRSIVFAHGLWADGSCFSKLIPTLQAEGHEVIAAQNNVDSLKGDVAAVHQCSQPLAGLFPSIIVAKILQEIARRALAKRD